MTDPFVRLQHLTKQFGEHVAVHDVSLDVPQGKVLALLGPSGSGKTTTLRLLAGFEAPDSGTIVVDGRDVTSLPAAVRRFGMVFQHYALFPHLDVGGNVAFGLGELTADERRRRVADALSLVDLAGFESRPVSALSGGQQQRVAVARALAPQPRVLLLDEPLSNLDPTLRERTRRELRTALERTAITTVFVTHEQEEAFALGDMVAVLNGGRLEQVGTAPELYDRPETLFVATFVGRASVLPGTVSRPGFVRVSPDAEWPVEGDTHGGPGTAVAVVVRPEAFRFTDGAGLPGTVTERRYVGARAFFRVLGHGVSVEVEAPVRAAEVGKQVTVVADRTRVFPA